MKNPKIAEEAIENISAYAEEIRNNFNLAIDSLSKAEIKITKTVESNEDFEKRQLSVGKETIKVESLIDSLKLYYKINNLKKLNKEIKEELRELENNAEKEKRRNFNEANSYISRLINEKKTEIYNQIYSNDAKAIKIDQNIKEVIDELKKMIDIFITNSHEIQLKKQAIEKSTEKDVSLVNNALNLIESEYGKLFNHFAKS